MELLIIGLITAINIIVIKMKFERSRTEDAIFDALLLGLVTVVFGGSYAGLVVATITSMFISIYLWSSPPKFFSGKNGVFDTFKEKMKKQNRRNTEWNL